MAALENFYLNDVNMTGQKCRFKRDPVWIRFNRIDPGPSGSGSPIPGGDTVSPYCEIDCSWKNAGRLVFALVRMQSIPFRPPFALHVDVEEVFMAKVLMAKNNIKT